MLVIKLTLLVLGTIGFVWVSRAALQDAKSHGFYRFFAWELILILFVLNMDYWFMDPFSLRQILSWIALFLSLPLVIMGVKLFLQKGKIDRERQAPDLFGFEKTTELVTTGIYHYIRHPFYSSLLFLAWGIFLKHFSWISFLLITAVTIFLVLTAKREEMENMAYFGEDYQVYMQNTKMFIPFIL